MPHEIHEVSAQIVNGFVAPNAKGGATTGIGGNPAGVVLDADDLSEKDMLAIAGKIGLSETAFVSQSETAGFKLDFFTPNRRIAHCGHATIATCSYLSALGRVAEGETSKETVDGPRKIIIKDGAAYMEQLAPSYRNPEAWAAEAVSQDDVLNSLGLTLSDLAPGSPPTLVNTGNSFVIIGVANAETLRQIRPDLAAINRISESLDLIGYYVFTTDPKFTRKAATTRMFAPRYGIDEESATGTAAGPLACYLHDVLGLRKPQITIEQGHFMEPASPSLITVDLITKNGKITSLMAGGRGVAMKRLKIRY